MDWLESHEAILNCKTKWLSLVDDEIQRHVIVGKNQGVSFLEVHLFLATMEDHAQGM
jgi:hypothetical protein